MFADRLKIFGMNDKEWVPIDWRCISKVNGGEKFIEILDAGFMVPVLVEHALVECRKKLCTAVKEKDTYKLYHTMELQDMGLKFYSDDPEDFVRYCQNAHAFYPDFVLEERDLWRLTSPVNKENRFEVIKALSEGGYFQDIDNDSFCPFQKVNDGYLHDVRFKAGGVYFGLCYQSTIYPDSYTNMTWEQFFKWLFEEDKPKKSGEKKKLADAYNISSEFGRSAEYDHDHE